MNNKDKTERFETIKAYCDMAIERLDDDNIFTHSLCVIKDVTDSLKNDDLKQKLLKAYNDYIVDEFEDERKIVLDKELGLMYSSIEDENDGNIRYVEYYYDTSINEFIGLFDDSIIYTKKATLEEAIDVIKNNCFDDYYSLMVDVYYSNDL